jgi:hypothetical protein
MEQSIRYQLTAHDTAVAVGTNVVAAGGAPYPLFHQIGTVHMEARPWLGMNDDNRDHVTEIMLDVLARGIRE